MMLSFVKVLINRKKYTTLFDKVAEHKTASEKNFSKHKIKHKSLTSRKI